MIGVPESEIQRFVRLHREAVQKLVERMAAAPDWERPRLFALVQQNLATLNDLDKQTWRWAKRNIGRVYEAAQKETEERLRALGLTRDDVQRAKVYSVINKQAVQALIGDPQTGLATSLGRGFDEIRARMLKIRQQATVMLEYQKVVDETIARVGILQGQSIKDIKKELVKELTGKAGEALAWRDKLRKLPPTHIFHQMAQIPYVTIPTKNGERQIRLDRYAEMLARTKTAQALGLARRNKLMEHGRGLVQVSNNLPLQDDACAVYMAKVYALTEAAAKMYDVPHIDRLPNGGTPFHPNCTHDEIPFFVEYESEQEKAGGFLPTPKWALDRTWPEVQREYEKRGGIKAAAKDNPNLFRAQMSGGKERHGTERPDLGEPPDDFWKRTPKGEGPAPVSPPATKVPEGPAGTAATVIPQPETAVLKTPGETTPAWLQTVRQEATKGIKTADDVVSLGTHVHEEILRETEKLRTTMQKKIDPLDAQAQKIVEQMVKLPFEETTELGEQFDNVTQQLTKLKTRRDNALKEAMDKVVGAAVDRTGMLNPAKATDFSESVVGKQAIKDASAILPKSWVNSINKTSAYGLERIGDFGKEAWVSTPARGQHTLGKIHIPAHWPKDNITDALVHELGHNVELNRPDINKIVREFLDKRTAGEEAKWMGPGYAKSEVTKKDKFPWEYMGKQYEGRGTEVLSMGLQALARPDMLAKLAREDPETLRFILGLLTGIP